MSADKAPSSCPEPLYAVTDWRVDGRKRVVAQYRDPDVARAHADALRRAGDPAEVELVTALQAPDGPPG